MTRKSSLEAEMKFQLVAIGLDPVPEFRFHPTRKWRFDFAFPDDQVAIECEGGTWGNRKSRHTTGSGFKGDCEKYNEAALLGWTVLRFTADMIRSGIALDQIETALGRSAA